MAESKLAAIMFTDISGYTAIMGNDEKKGLEILKQNRDLQKPLIESLNGKYLKEMGDGIMAQFDSAFDAVSCAMEIQEGARSLENKIRVGIHLGEVTIDEDDIFGDGVNIASRLESIAEPGGIYVSESVQRTLRSRNEFQWIHLGEVDLKNVAFPINAYCLSNEGLAVPSHIGTDSSKLKRRKSWQKIALTFVPILLAPMYFMDPFGWFEEDYGMPEYEKYFYDGRFRDAYEITSGDLDIRDDRKNYFHILNAQNASELYRLDLQKPTLHYYRNLTNQYPDSAKSHLYLALAFNYIGGHEGWSHDSAWISLKKAESLGGSGKYFDLVKWAVYEHLGSNRLKLESAKTLFEKYPDDVRAQRLAGATFINEQDTTNAIVALKASIRSYEGYATPYNLLSQIFLDQGEYDSALQYASIALDKSPNHVSSVEAMAGALKGSGRFEESKLLLREKIDDPNLESVSLYDKLIWTLAEQDSIDEAFKLSEIALSRYPDHPEIKGSRDLLNDRRNQMLKNRQLSLQEKILPWLNNYDQALERARELEKPVLIEFNFTDDWNSKRRDRWIYTDSSVQVLLDDFIRVKLNKEKEKVLANQYGVKSEAMFVLDQEGNMIMEIDDEEFSDQLDNARDWLNRGQEAFTRLNESKKIPGSPFTSISNFEDAVIVAKNRNFPILVIVGNDQSKWSNDLVNQSLNDPKFKAAFKDLIVVYLESAIARQYPEWNIQTYPTTLFFSSDGVLQHKLLGYQSAETLNKVLKQMRNRKPVRKEINWIHSFEEAKTIATITRRDIVVQAGPDENGLFEFPELIAEIGDEFVFAKLDKEDPGLKKAVPEFWVGGGQWYFNPSGQYLKNRGFSRPRSFIEWLRTQDEKELISMIGPDRYVEFSTKLELAQILSNRDCVQSAIELYKELIDEVPTYSRLHFAVGDLYMYQLKQYAKAIPYYEKAFQNGEPMGNARLARLVFAYIGTEDMSQLKNSLEDLIRRYSDPEKRAIIHNQFSLFYHGLGDIENAIIHAKKAISYQSDYDNNLQLGKLYFQAKQYIDARKYLSKASKIHPRPADALLYLSFVADSTGNVMASNRYLDLAVEARDGRRRMPWLRIPKIHQYPSMLEMAEFNLRTGLLLFPESRPDLRYELAGIQAIQGKNLDEAEKLMEDGIGSDPAPGWSFVYPMQAWIQFENGNVEAGDETIQKLKEMISSDWLEDNFLAHYAFYLQAKAHGNREDQMLYGKNVVQFNNYMDIEYIELYLQEIVKEELEYPDISTAP